MNYRLIRLTSAVEGLIEITIKIRAVEQYENARPCKFRCSVTRRNCTSISSWLQSYTMHHAGHYRASWNVN